MTVLNNNFLSELAQIPDLNSLKRGKWAVNMQGANKIVWLDPLKPLERGYTIELQEVSRRINDVIKQYERFHKEQFSKEKILKINATLLLLNEKIEKRNSSKLRKILYILTLGFGFKKVDKVNGLSLESIDSFLNSIGLFETGNKKIFIPNLTVRVKYKREEIELEKRLKSVDDVDKFFKFLSSNEQEEEVLIKYDEIERIQILPKIALDENLMQEQLSALEKYGLFFDNGILIAGNNEYQLKVSLQDDVIKVNVFKEEEDVHFLKEENYRGFILINPNNTVDITYLKEFHSVYYI